MIYLVLMFFFDFNMKKLKEIAEDKVLDELTQKYPENRNCLWEHSHL